MPHEAELLTGKTGEAAALAIRRRGARVVAVEATGDGDVFAWDDQVRTVQLTDERVLVATLTHALLHGEAPWTATHQAVHAAGRTGRHLGGRPDLGSRSAVRGTSRS
jgi:hypothetical protein